MDCSTPGLPVLHYLLEHAKTHVHWIGDAIQPSHPLSSSFPSFVVSWLENFLCCCFSVTQSCPTLCDPMDCSMSGFPVLHHLPEFAQTHVHRVGDAIQSSHPLSSPSPTFSLSQHESFPMSQFFASGSQSIGDSASASDLPMNIQGWFPLGLTGLFSLQSKGLSRVFSNTTVQKHEFFGTQPSLWSNSLWYPVGFIQKK